MATHTHTYLNAYMNINVVIGRKERVYREDNLTFDLNVIAN